jgi:transposase InsO family protein
MSEDPVVREQIAYFRYAVIAPLLAEEPGVTLAERIRRQADRQWAYPSGRVRTIAFATIEKWLYAYREGGIEALQVRRRRDAGTFRGIDEDLSARIDTILADHPTLRTHAIIDHLASQDQLGDPPPSHSTLYRYIKAHRPTRQSGAPSRERRSFEAPYAGYLWQADIMYGPHLPDRLPNGRTRKRATYLIAILDDHSRLLCHGQFFFRQDLASWLDCLHTAVRKRGIPRKLYCDNGQVFTAEQVRRIVAALGIELIHTKVRDPAAKGKIERLFQKVRRSFLEPAMELAAPTSLGQLNDAFFSWMENAYNHRVHSAFGATPIRRFMESASRLRTLPDDGHSLFHVHYERLVKKDGTFSLNGTRFETVPGLVGCKVTVSYDLHEPSRVFVQYDGASYGRANVLDRKGNAMRPRDNANGQQEDRPDA